MKNNLIPRSCVIKYENEQVIQASIDEFLQVTQLGAQG